METPPHYRAKTDWFEYCYQNNIADPCLIHAGSYITRAGKKEDVPILEDLKKAKHCIERAIAHYEDEEKEATNQKEIDYLSEIDRLISEGAKEIGISLNVFGALKRKGLQEINEFALSHNGIRLIVWEFFENGKIIKIK